MANYNHYIIQVDVAERYEIEIDAPSEAKAIKMAEKAVKNHDVDPEERTVEVVDIFETPDEGFIEE